MDIGLALTYVTRDPQWVKKVLIGGVIVLVSFVTSIILVGLLGFFVFYGYGIRTIRNVIDGVEHPLPEWDDIGGDLGRGFFAFVGLLVWALPLIVLFVCSFMLSAVSDTLGGLAFLGAYCLSIPFGILLNAFVAPTILGRFAVTNDFSSMIQFNEVFETIRGLGVGPYLLFFVLTIITGFIGWLGIIACGIGIVLTLTYAAFANFHGIGQIYRLSQGSGVGAPATEHPAF